MKKALLLIMSFMFMLSPVSSNVPEKVIITDNGGGSIILFERIVGDHRRLKTPVEFKGLCASACTLFLTLPEEQLCIHPTGILLFHNVYRWQGMNKVPLPENTRRFVEKLPFWVQEYLNNKGGLVELGWIVMTYEYASQHMRTCKA